MARRARTCSTRRTGSSTRSSGQVGRPVDRRLALAARPDVRRDPRESLLPDSRRRRGVRRSAARPATTEWGLNAIHAPQVWSTFNDRGEGIVISSIGHGCPLLAPGARRQVPRATWAAATSTNNYNWWDPLARSATTRIRATRKPNSRHAHDGNDGRRRRRSGHEPDRRRTAREVDLGEGAAVSTRLLISSGQWILAPTDLNGDNPRPDLRPDIVNNSWGGGSGDPFFQPDSAGLGRGGHLPGLLERQQRARRAAPAGSPGDLPETYAAGAFDINGADRGLLVTRPIGIRRDHQAEHRGARASTFARCGWDSDTQLRQPERHLDGRRRTWPATVALIWSISPELRGRRRGATGDAASTRRVDRHWQDLRRDAPRNNNTWGEGKLDARSQR